MATKNSWSMDENNYLDGGSVYVQEVSNVLPDALLLIYNYLSERVETAAPSITDCNSITKSGFYRAPTGTLNVPVVGNGWYIYHACTASAYGAQIAVSMANNRQVFVRNIINGTWTAWIELAKRNNTYGDLNYTGATYVISPESVSCANDTVTDLASVSLPKGIYVLSGIVRFGANGTGLRKMSFSNTAGTDGSAIDSDIRNAVPGDMTYCRVTTVREVTETSEIWYLNAKQTSGSALGALGRIKIVRIA